MFPKCMHSALAAAVTVGSIGMTNPLQLHAQEPEPATVIYACYVPGSGLVYRVQETDTKPGCSATRHILFSWNTQGPAGPPGPPGGGGAGVACSEGEFLRGFDETGAAVCARPTPPLSVIATANPASGVAPMVVSLDCGVAGGRGLLSFVWELGDGGTSTERNPVHTYGAPGVYVATCAVTDEDQNQGIDGATITVDADLIPAANAVAVPATGRSPHLAHFACVATGGNEPLTFAWVFGDGAISETQNPSHTYETTTGQVFNALCTVTDRDGDAATDGVSVQVAPDRSVIASVAASRTTGPDPLHVDFACNAANGDPPFTYAWTFGDGSSGTSQNLTHIYDVGTYTATCVVTDADGDQGADALTVTVTPDQQPFVEAAAVPSSGQAPLTVSFTCNVLGGDGPLTFDWDFGDGSTSLFQTPSHVYSIPGGWPARCTVTDADGDIGASEVTVVVTP